MYNVHDGVDAVQLRVLTAPSRRGGPVTAAATTTTCPATPTATRTITPGTPCTTSMTNKDLEHQQMALPDVLSGMLWKWPTKAL
jgi:hypothetical protein